MDHKIMRWASSTAPAMLTTKLHSARLIRGHCTPSCPASSLFRCFSMQFLLGYPKRSMTVAIEMARWYVGNVPSLHQIEVLTRTR